MKCKHCGEEIELTMSQGWLHVIPRWPVPPKIEKTCKATVAEPAEEIPWGWICRVCKTGNEEWRDQCRRCQAGAWSKIVMKPENPQTEADLRETREAADTAVLAALKRLYKVYHPSWPAMALLILKLYEVKK